MAVTMVDTPTGAEVEAEAGVGGPIVVSFLFMHKH